MQFQTIVDNVRETFQRATHWLRNAEGWQIALVALALVVLVPLTPALLLLAGAAALFIFAKAWVREFVFLMRLGDDAFPGQNDKLIWAMLLIVLPPAGVWLFQGYREAHWPVAKPAKQDPAQDWY